MQLIALLLPWAIAAADDDGEGAKTLSARDEALIEYTFKVFVALQKVSIILIPRTCSNGTFRL